MSLPRQAFRVLQFAFVVVPIIAGLDKFFNLLTNWSQYLSPPAMGVLGGGYYIFMGAVGIVEIIVGLGNIWRPIVFSYLVAIWLALIVANLIIGGQFLDIALRDIGLFLAAVAFICLSHEYSKGKKG